MGVFKTSMIFSATLAGTAVFATTYYVSPTGADSNAGTSTAQPFCVVQTAIDQMNAGDTLVVMDGIYAGKLTLKSGITIKAQNPRKVVFSGVERLKARFERHDDNIYKTRISGSPKQFFYNNQPMTWARWPNAAWADNWVFDKKWAMATKGTGPGVLTSKAFAEVKDLDLSGGYCFIRYGKGNSCYSRAIESFDGETLRWNDKKFYSSKYTGEDGRKGSAEALRKMKKNHENHPSKSEFFLVGALGLLDAPGEWFVKDGTLYLYPPDGKTPDESVILAKTIVYCIDQEEAVSDVTMEGIDFLACSVRLSASGNSNLRFENVHFNYINSDLLHVNRVRGDDVEKPVWLAGSGIEIEKCLFAGAQQAGLVLTGADLRVENCVFMENNRNATFERRPLRVYPEGHYKITRNTFFNNPSDAIRIVPDLSKMQSLNPEVSYNHIFNGGLYNTDVSGVYFPSKSQRYAEVHHNWFHNINGNAVRLDIAGKELNVHHNMFWSTWRALSIEGYGLFNIYNNTAIYSLTPSDLIRNVLNHSGSKEGSMDLSFPPIDDWNVLNNLIDDLTDRNGPREFRTMKTQKKKGLLHPERDKSFRIPVVNRGTLQGNMIGFDPELFVNGSLDDLNLMPAKKAIKGGVKQTKELAAQGVTQLGSYRGAYDVNGETWVPGSDWMPYGLPVLKTMAVAEAFAKKYKTISIVPDVGTEGLSVGWLSFKQ